MKTEIPLAEVEDFIKNNPDLPIDMNVNVAGPSIDCGCLIVEFARHKFGKDMLIKCGFSSFYINEDEFVLDEKIKIFVWRQIMKEPQNQVKKLSEVTL